MKKLMMAAAISALLAAGPAAAQAYVGIGVGAAKTDSNETSTKIYGGFQFNPTWGLELAITDFDRYRGADLESWSIAGTGTLPIADRLTLLGKLGATSNRPKFSGGSTCLPATGVWVLKASVTSMSMECTPVGNRHKTDQRGWRTGMAAQ